MAFNSGQPARDLFPRHNVGAGKGDKSRHKFNKAWRDNYDEIDFSGSVTEFFRKGSHKLVRIYKQFV